MYLLDNKLLENGQQVLLLLGGNQGWEPVEIAGLPATLRAKVSASDGKQLLTSLPVDEVELRWP